MSGPQIRLCLFTFRPIASKQSKSLLPIDSVSWIGRAVVTHPLRLQKVTGSIPSSGNGFMFDYFFCVFLLFVYGHIIWHKIL